MLRRVWSATYKLLLPAAALLLCAGHALASSTATITVGGSEQYVSGSWDHGTITISFNGYVESVSYGQFSSPASVAAALAGMFSRDFAADGLSAKANCPPNGAEITFTLQGSAAFGTLDVQGPRTSFQFSSSGFQATSLAVADYGTVALTVTVGSNVITAAQTNYGVGATPASIAEGLASAVTANSPVTITAVNDELDLQAKAGGSSTNYSYTLQTTSYDSSVFSEPSFMYPPATGNLSGGANQNTTGATIYQYTIPSSGGYAANSNLTEYNDSVMGAWSFTYDNLNRLKGGIVTPAVDSDTYFCWSYDNWGNRLQQMGSNETISGGGESTCAQQSGSNVNLAWANYSSSNNNQMTTSVQDPSGVQYSAAGDVTNDGNTNYLYNANGQICAVEQQYEGMTVMMGYIYDADGERVAKGTITSFTSCDPSVNGFVATANYVRDQAGNQLSEIAPDSNGNYALVHTNVYASGMLMATYDAVNLHFYLNDWLGTRRVQTDYSGVVEQDCMSLPYGDSETCTPLPTENLYTGKEKDAETAGGVSPFGVNQGNDYFGARYYGSTMGRFLSPDPSGLLAQHPEDPQSWNLYAYVRNNPLINIDPTGLGCVTDLGQGSDANHESVEINNSINSDDCASQHGTWVPGDINKDDIGAYRGDDGNINFQVTTNTGGNVYYSSFVSGAQTDANGVGPGADISHVSTSWLSGQLVGGSLDQLMSFAAQRMQPRGGGDLMALLANPGLSLDAPDNWAGPGGMGTPQGQGDWAAMAHDYNFLSNGITIGSYFNPFLSRATAKALIQSDNNLIGHAGGVQAVKMGMFFGVVNAFQWLTHPF